MRYKIVVEYDGTDYRGWQIQPEGRTIQGELERALSEFGEGRISVIGAGRTDTGVHALGQAAHFDLNREIDAGELMSALNAKIPKDILVKSVETVHPAFHARYDALWRKYLYVITKSPTAIGLRFSWHPPFKYDFQLLRELPAEIIGQRDFAAFCRFKSQKENTVCTVSNAVWSENEAQRVFEIAADRFLHQMVRLLVGTMMDISRGRFQPDAMAEIIASRAVESCGISAPPQGLFLAEVGY